MVPDSEVRNARIVDTYLGYEDHGIFIVQVNLDYGSSRQSLQYAVSPESDLTLLTVLKELMNAVGVMSWEQLKGKHCRAMIQKGMVRQLGNIIEDTWSQLKWDL